MEINVVNISGKETGVTAQLSDSIFGIEPNDHAIYLDVKQFLANQRQGTHKAKQRKDKQRGCILLPILLFGCVNSADAIRPSFKRF